MRRYELEKEREGSTVYFFFRDVETLDIVLLPTKYLMHKIRSKCSPNTVRRSALAILYYLEYIHEKKKELTDVYQMPYVEQTNHFVEFLYWLKAGKHTRDKNHRSPNNGTCNAYLRDVFRFYLFIEEEYQQFGELKVLSYNYFVAVDAVGVKKSIRSKSFKGYLKEEEHKARAAKKDEIVEILKACTNIRDRLLMLLLAETGYRIGELLAITKADINFEKNQLSINKTYYRTGMQDIITEPKTKQSFRTIEIPEFLKEEIKEFVDGHYGMSDTERLFPVVQEAVQHKMKRQIELAGVKKIRVHDIRHSHVAYLIEKGVEPLLIRDRLGHKDIRITLNTYGHLYPNQQRKIANLLDNENGNAVTGLGEERDEC